jgi:hypothetical protein
VKQQILYISWSGARSVIAAATIASLAWSAIDFFYPISWIVIFSIFAAIYGVLFLVTIFTKLPRIDPAGVNDATRTDVYVFALSILQAVISAVIPAILAIVVINLVSRWTGKPTDWLHPSLFFPSLFLILYPDEPHFGPSE